MDMVPNISVGQGDLEQLLLNLVVNARDAMPQGGTLSIAIQRVGERVEIVIRDTGCGIPPNHMSRIQEPFFTTKPNGNGLGLSICRSIVWNARGEMRIDSQVGLGTQMKVSLPVVDERTGGRMA
jgi:signal transduction histidine kinase